MLLQYVFPFLDELYLYIISTSQSDWKLLVCVTFSKKLPKKKDLIFSKSWYGTLYKKCNLTLAMSLTCHSDKIITICWREFFWECSQSQLAQCQIHRSDCGRVSDSYLQCFLRYEFIKVWQTDGRTESNLHMSPPCNMRRWAKKLGYPANCLPMCDNSKTWTDFRQKHFELILWNLTIINQRVQISKVWPTSCLSDWLFPVWSVRSLYQGKPTSEQKQIIPVSLARLSLETQISLL